ncbi:MAG: hypothetical protein BWK77_03995 [Verrucomicrobia bacterium A1]|nr:MAG: hypothetical protein BWK77_03995 [Verrucomicrobia bacterium A1]
MATTAPAALYEVGPTNPCRRISDVPWTNVGPGDVVLIHWRETPYFEKWVLCRQGASNAPIVVRGVPNRFGELPVIDGNGAVNCSNLNFWGEERGVIKIGGANTPSDLLPAHIVLENLDIRGGRAPAADLHRR